MKVRNYEKKDMIIFFMILLLIIEIIVVVILLTVKIEKYQIVSGIVIKDNLALVVVSSDERRIIYSNKILYLNNHKYKYEIVEDRGKVLKKDDGYYQLVLKFKFNKKYKVNDLLEIVFVKEKMYLIEIFKIIWEGD